MSYKKITLKFCILSITTLLLYGCQQKSDVKNDFECKERFFTDLEEVIDVKNNFVVQVPKHWKKSLYTDESQSSIYFADTTKQLTEAILLDINFITNSIQIDDVFKLKIEQEILSDKLIQIRSKEISFLQKPSYYTVSIGKKGKFKLSYTFSFCFINF
ncbi:hypothetical protein [uncultured Polaribacter sp.]|uniref:hypothetical protein n=1 Tax=uncultured Polaribacter sp. TaxID=174711 RepID=UPI00261D84B6|nr:hypothetical protein [uncultured Polaribacter sp.]